VSARRIRCDDAVLVGISLYHLKFNGTHASSDKEEVSLTNWAVSLQEVGLQEDVEEVSGDSLDGVVNWQNMHTFTIFDIRALVYGDNISEASISSMKMIAGEFFSASSKALRKFDSDSPANLDMISGPLIKKKNAPVSLATALAISVFPDPGGPNIRMPRGGFTPMDLKSCGCRRGSSTCDTRATCVSIAPTETRPWGAEANQFTNVAKLLADATDVIVANIVHAFLILPFDGLTFTMNDLRKKWQMSVAS